MEKAQQSEDNNWFPRNIKHLQEEIEWFINVARTRVAIHFKNGERPFPSIADIPIPELLPIDTPYAEFVHSLNLSPAERLVLILAILPHIQPQELDIFVATHGDKMAITEFGGVKDARHRGFLPTAETALFVMSGDELAERLIYQQFLQPEATLFKGKWLSLENPGINEPLWTSAIVPSTELLAFTTTGYMGDPEFGTKFPAEKIETERTWDELVLSGETMNEVQEVLDWILHEQTVLKDWGLGQKLMPGYRALFYGPPGTGKTFTTTLMGKAAGREVYRIDLSMVVSKYIGETEKNLKNVFDKAQSRGWILFFDEADALFGKRTSISDSKDRFANQEVSYLLQRVESFDGVAILATNNRDNLDAAFTRRFQSVVYFPVPTPVERLRLWKSSIPEKFSLAEDVNLDNISHRFELSGGSIMNVIRTCALRAAKRGEPIIRAADFQDGIRKEYRKTGRILQ